MHITRIGAAAGIALILAGAPIGSALAQSSAGAMPPPPSASDPLPKEKAPATPKKTRAAKPKAAGGASSTGSGASSPNYRDRIEGSGELQLQDDPRGVRPTMEGGRPGMGMRF